MIGQVKRAAHRYLLNVNHRKGGLTGFYRRLSAAIASLSFNDREWEALIIEWYRVKHWQDPTYTSDKLFDWEQLCVSTYFPSPPASILVLAAGKGRELRALQKLGYSVYGVEMDLECLEIARRITSPIGMLGTARASFLDIAESTWRLPDALFNGIIIGWAALTHLSSQGLATELFRKLSEQYPGVPMIMSRAHIPKIRGWHRLLSAILLRKSRPFYRSFHYHYGPLAYISIEDLEKLLTDLNYSILTRSKREEHPHLVVRAYAPGDDS